MAKATMGRIHLDLEWEEMRALLALVGRVNGHALDGVYSALSELVPEDAEDVFEITASGLGSRPVISVRRASTGEMV